MAQTREWPRTREGLVAGSLILLNGFIFTASWGLDRSSWTWVVALFNLALGCMWVERELWYGQRPAVRLDDTRLETFGPLGPGQQKVIELADVTGIEWESMGIIGLRLRSGEVRPVDTKALRKRDRAEFGAALRAAIDARRAA